MVCAYDVRPIDTHIHVLVWNSSLHCYHFQQIITESLIDCIIYVNDLDSNLFTSYPLHNFHSTVFYFSYLDMNLHHFMHLFIKHMAK